LEEILTRARAWEQAGRYSVSRDAEALRSGARNADVSASQIQRPRASDVTRSAPQSLRVAADGGSGLGASGPDHRIPQQHRRRIERPCPTTTPPATTSPIPTLTTSTQSASTSSNTSARSRTYSTS